MHGIRKYRVQDLPEAKQQALRDRVGRYQKASEGARGKRAVGDTSEEALELTTQCLLENQDYYTMWNLRRDILEKQWSTMHAEGELSQAKRQELAFNNKALHANPKVYCIWNHRKWVVQGFPECWKEELALCEQFLQLDERNFHCWSYRRFVLALEGVPASTEIRFSRKKLNENFSNYSAWHHRTNLLTEIMADKTPQERRKIISDEFDLVENAFFTDPEDQSAWFYHRWLLGRVPSELFVEQVIPRTLCSVRERGFLAVAFSSPVKNVDTSTMVVKALCGASETTIEGVWQPASSGQGHGGSSFVWISFSPVSDLQPVLSLAGISICARESLSARF